MSNSADLLHHLYTFPLGSFEDSFLETLHAHAQHIDSASTPPHNHDRNDCMIVKDELLIDENVFPDEDGNIGISFNDTTFRSIRATIIFINRFIKEGVELKWENKIRDVDNEEDFFDITITFMKDSEEVGF